MPNKGLKVPLLALVSLIAVYLSWGKSPSFFLPRNAGCDGTPIPSFHEEWLPRRPPSSPNRRFWGLQVRPFRLTSDLFRNLHSPTQWARPDPCILATVFQSIITLSLYVSEANIRRPHSRRSKRTRTCAKTQTPDASGARSPIHLPNEPGPTCMTRGLGSGNDAVASWPQGPRGYNNWPVEEPRDLGPREPPRLGVLSPSPCLHPRREGYWAPLTACCFQRNPALCVRLFLNFFH